MNMIEKIKPEWFDSTNNISRKAFLSTSLKSVAAISMGPYIIHPLKAKTQIKAVAFDAYTLFDTSSILTVAEQLYPGRSKELLNNWRTKQFEYTWLRSLSRHYTNFWNITEDALIYAVEFLKLELTSQNKFKLMQSFLDIKFVSKASEVLKSFKAMKIQLAILSNATPNILDAGINNSGLQDIFDFVISTDRIKTYKPDPAAYQLGIDAFKVKKEEILFVAFGGWDEAGAKSFGYPTVWINANGLPVERLGVYPDFVCKNLTELGNYVKMINND